MAKYKCPCCERIVWRDSDKKWRKSWCKSSDRFVRLQRIDSVDSRMKKEKK